MTLTHSCGSLEPCDGCIVWSGMETRGPFLESLFLRVARPATLDTKARGPVDHSTGPLNRCALGRIRTCNLLIRRRVHRHHPRLACWDSWALSIEGECASVRGCTPLLMSATDVGCQTLEL